MGLTDIDEPFPFYFPQGMVTKDGSAMSKSKGNVVEPDEIWPKYGADTLRLFILFASPPDKEFVWNEKGIEGCFRFLNRIWSFFHENKDLFDKEYSEKESSGQKAPVSGTLEVKLHQTVKKVTEDIEKRYHLNTVISSVMEFFNQIKKETGSLTQSEAGRALLKKAFETMILILSPFTPHVCEELWEKMGMQGLLACTPWPSFDPELAKEETITIVVQVNGKMRGKFDVERDLSEEEVKKMALKLDRIQDIIGERSVKKVIYIKNKLVSIVI
jgi:leucyl-tRNA synthetase